MQRINSINWDQPRQQSQVKFFYDNEGQAEEDDLLGNVNFVRHDTPHPKELKARHQKLFNKGLSDGEMNPSTTTAENTLLNDQQESTKSESGSSDATSVIVRQSYDGTLNAKTNTVQNLNEIDNDGNQDMLDNYLDTQDNHPLDQYAKQQYLNDEQQQIDYQNEPNQDDYTMEENKHVIFNPEYSEDANCNDQEQQQNFEPLNKLHRRDTPHHLKNKRINSMTNKADADKVASILDRLNNQMNYDEDASMKTASSSSVNNSIANNMQTFNDVNNPEFQPMEPCEVKQIRFHLTRLPPPFGLGL